MFQTLFFKKLNIASFVLSGVLLGIPLTTSVFAMDDENQDKIVRVEFRCRGFTGRVNVLDIAQTTSYQDLYAMHDNLFPKYAPAKALLAVYENLNDRVTNLVVVTEDNWPFIRERFFFKGGEMVIKGAM